MIFSVVEGTDKDFILTLKDERTGVAIDITSATMTFAVYTSETSRTGSQSAVLTKTVGAGIALTTAASGIFTISIADTDTDDFAGVGTYDWELEITLSNGKVYAISGREGFVIAPRRRLDA